MTTKQQEAKKILNVLESQRFADFYGEGGEFDNYVRMEYPKDHPSHISKEMILEKIARMFDL